MAPSLPTFAHQNVNPLSVTFFLRCIGGRGSEREFDGQVKGFLLVIHNTMVYLCQHSLSFGFVFLDVLNHFKSLRKALGRRIYMHIFVVCFTHGLL